MAEESGPAATWGQVCIALLIQRASDKAPAVRAKAVGNLAALIETWCSQQTGPLAATLALFRQVSYCSVADSVLVICKVKRSDSDPCWFCDEPNVIYMIAILISGHLQSEKA